MDTARGLLAKLSTRLEEHTPNDPLVEEVDAFLARPDGDGWVRCEERMPSHPIGGTWAIYVLAKTTNMERPRLLSYYTGPQPRWYDEQDNQFHGDVTHWMPLPEEPRA